MRPYMIFLDPKMYMHNHTDDIIQMLTRRGFDQENNAPDNANETQSTGVPE